MLAQRDGSNRRSSSSSSHSSFSSSTAKTSLPALIAVGCFVLAVLLLACFIGSIIAGVIAWGITGLVRSASIRKGGGCAAVDGGSYANEHIWSYCLVSLIVSIVMAVVSVVIRTIGTRTSSAIKARLSSSISSNRRHRRLNQHQQRNRSNNRTISILLDDTDEESAPESTTTTTTIPFDEADDRELLDRSPPDIEMDEDNDEEDESRSAARRNRNKQKMKILNVPSLIMAVITALASLAMFTWGLVSFLVLSPRCREYLTEEHFALFSFFVFSVVMHFLVIAMYVLGLCCFGAGVTLLTLGPDFVEQFRTQMELIWIAQDRAEIAEQREQQQGGGGGGRSPSPSWHRLIDEDDEDS